MRLPVLMLLASSACSPGCTEKRDTTPVVVTQPAMPADKKEAGKFYPYEGCEANGEIITQFDCPDDLSFPPINIREWDKVPVVNGRLPTYKEVEHGMSIHHYGGNENPFIKPYYMTLPKLASIYRASTGQEEVVVVIQIVHNAKDTVASYRYLTGGVGGSLLRNFHFLTEEEVRIVGG